MKSPRRILSAWSRYYRLRGRVDQIEQRLAQQLGTPLRLRPAKLSGGGQDTIYHARTLSQPHRTIASLRICCLQQSRLADEPELPRCVLSPAARIVHESDCYSRLALLQISPSVLLQAEDFLANEWLPWPRVSQVLKGSEDQLWNILPLAISTVQKMHSLQVVHLDLNCGNLLLRPDGRGIAIVDFEYGAAEGTTIETMKAFDYIRLAHGFLKRRRGLGVIRREPDRFAAAFTEQIPVGQHTVLAGLSSRCFERISRHEVIRDCFQHLFGPFPCDQD